MKNIHKAMLETYAEMYQARAADAYHKLSTATEANEIYKIKLQQIQTINAREARRLLFELLGSEPE